MHILEYIHQIRAPLRQMQIHSRGAIAPTIVPLERICNLWSFVEPMREVALTYLLAPPASGETMIQFFHSAMFSLIHFSTAGSAYKLSTGMSKKPWQRIGKVYALRSRQGHTKPAIRTDRMLTSYNQAQKGLECKIVSYWLTSVTANY